MKLSSLKILAAAVALAFPMMASATTSNLVTNGNFESGSLSGWTLSGTSYWNTITSPSKLFLPTDPNGNGNFVYAGGQAGGYSSISQTISLAAQTTYTVSFDYLNTLPFKTGTNLKQGFQLSVGDAAATDVLDMAYSVSKTNAYSPTWTTYTETFFSADATSLVLKLKSRNDASFNYFDNIQISAAVTPVPEPESYAMLLAGLGLMGTIIARRRKNQYKA